MGIQEFSFKVLKLLNWKRKVSSIPFIWTERCNKEGRPDLGTVLMKAGRRLSCGEKVPSLYYTLTAHRPHFLWTLLSSEGEENLKKKKKRFSGAVSRRAAFESSALGFRCSGLANTCPAGVFTSWMTFLWRVVKRVSHYRLKLSRVELTFWKCEDISRMWGHFQNVTKKDQVTEKDTAEFFFSFFFHYQEAVL